MCDASALTIGLPPLFGGGLSITEHYIHYNESDTPSKRKRGVMIELTDSCIVMLPEPKELPDSIYVVRYKLVFARQAFHYRD
jgi:hypothetical protein